MVAQHRRQRKAEPRTPDTSMRVLAALCLAGLMWSGASARAAQPDTVTVYHLKGGRKIAGWRVGSTGGRTMIKKEDGDRVFIKEADIVKTETRKAKPAAKAEKSKTGKAKTDKPKAKLTKRVTFSFASTPLLDAAKFLQKASGVDIVTTESVEKKRVRAKGKNQTLKQALDQICRNARCRWQEVRGEVYIVDPKAARKAVMASMTGKAVTMESPVFDKRVTLDCQETPLSDVAVVLQETTCARVMVYPRYRNKPITVKVEDMRLRQFIDLLAAMSGAEVASKGTMVFLK